MTLRIITDPKMYVIWKCDKEECEDEIDCSRATKEGVARILLDAQMHQADHRNHHTLVFYQDEL